ncbi:hypothetical protein HYPSUDRAFT_46575 [Hypholoma sublateritium FD-334 SS-4]|uniref:AB hydrolase-1 domain-containing protein n=1 Tax=Hypholoma sublateritium (strain FD-334 SS-4) TaxID=945553 RepID=A0A0D2PAL1_HYPSF|nr:hypothetical protein HYPSUDRAFT_46575 [Hypholoma sublateritium FD-334 SS-4]
MQKIKVTDDIEFAYQDSGAPLNKADYPTIVFIHGHTYHSGAFAKMLASAAAGGYRLILPNRRLYPGSTPYTADEIKAMDASNAPEDIATAFSKQGEYLLLFIDKIIQQLGLESVSVGGWSLGTSFMNSLVGAIEAVDAETKARVTEHVKGLIWWDPPATGHGFDDPPTGGWIPLYDESIAPEQRAQAFVSWVTQYYPHPDLEKKDCYKLIYKLDDPIKRPTFTDVPFEEILKMVDFSAGPTADNHVADFYFQPAHRILREKAFFNSKIREAWHSSTFSVVYGEQTTYNIIWGVWKLQEESEKTGLPIAFKAMPGVNHFGMYDEPQLVLSTIQSCA